MNTNTTKTYRYTATITGEGGDFFFVPMTAEQVAFWRKKGEDALAEHLNGDSDDSGVPAEMKLGHYLDIGDQVGGLDLDMDGSLVVRDEQGKSLFQKSLQYFQSKESVEVAKVVDAPDAGGFLRTFERSEWTYELELTEPFKPSKLRLKATDTPVDELVNGLIYADNELDRSEEVDQEISMHKAFFLVV